MKEKTKGTNMKNKKQSPKNKKSVKHTEENNKYPEIIEIPATDQITLLRENYYLMDDPFDSLRDFFDSFMGVLKTENIKNSHEIKGKHIIKALFNLYKCDSGKAIMDFFELECKNIFAIFKEISSLTEEDKLNWIIETLLNPEFELEYNNDNQTALQTPQ